MSLVLNLPPELETELLAGASRMGLPLPKYNLLETTISEASKIEQWAFFLLHADQYDPDELRDLLPGVEFDQAITVIETISQKTEDRTMYDQREKALRDHQWLLEGALQKGRVDSLSGVAPRATWKPVFMSCRRTSS